MENCKEIGLWKKFKISLCGAGKMRKTWRC